MGASATPAQEVRLALVLNGGASLAVWMGGVTHEIDLLRRATSGTALDAVREEDRPVFECWRSLCGTAEGTIERKVVVDIVAGTSAGGLNGTLLATAIARGAALDPAPGNGQGARLRQVWSATASMSLGALLPALDVPHRPSILDGDYFTAAVDKALRDIDGDAEQAQPVTLYVTATSMNPSAKIYRDSFGQPLTCTDHRRLYRFQRTSGLLAYHPPEPGTAPSEEMFTPADVHRFDGERNTAALTTATRASASFPVAFAPVLESAGLMEPGIRVRGDDSGSWLIDGGVLDNAPFDPVLKTISRTPLSGRVRRLLVYVVPSSGLAAPDAGSSSPAMPPWYQVAGSTLSDLREVDLRGHVERLQALLRDTQGQWSDTARLFGSLLADEHTRAEASTAARALLPTYRRGSTVGGVQQARLIRDAGSTELAATPVSEEDLRHVRPLWVPAADQDLVAAPWQWGVAAAERTVLLLVRDLRRRLDEAPQDAQGVSDGLTALSGRWLPRITAVDRGFTDALRARAAGAAQEVSVAAIVEDVNEVSTALRVDEVLAWLVEQAVEVYRVAAGPGLTAEAVLRSALCVEVLSRAFHVRTPPTPFAPFEFLRLGPDVAMPVLADRREKATADALGEDKLYGSRADAFAAFGAPSWRRWDWLMGRLDAVAHLGQALGAPEGWVARTQAAVLASEGVSTDELAAGIAAMPGVTTASLLDELGRTRQGRTQRRDLADSAVDLLARGSRPTAVGSLTHPLAFLLRRQPVPTAGWLGTAMRWLTEPARRRLWQLVGPPEEVTVASTPVPLALLLVPLLSLLLLVTAALSLVAADDDAVAGMFGGVALTLAGIGFLLTLGGLGLRQGLAHRVVPHLVHEPVRDPAQHTGRGPMRTASPSEARPAAGEARAPASRR